MTLKSGRACVNDRVVRGVSYFPLTPGIVGIVHLNATTGETLRMPVANSSNNLPAEKSLSIVGFQKNRPTRWISICVVHSRFRRTSFNLGIFQGIPRMFQFTLLLNSLRSGVRC